MNIACINKTNNINSNQNSKNNTYPQNFGQVVFSPPSAKDQFLNEVARIPRKNRKIITRLRKLIFLAERSPKKATIVAKSSIELADENKNPIKSVFLCSFAPPEPIYLRMSSVTSTRKRKPKTPPKPAPDMFYLGKLIEGLEIITQGAAKVPRAKDLPSIGKLVEDCQTEEFIPLHLRLIREGKY